MFLAYLVMTYLLAAIPFGLVVTTVYGADADVRTSGSGNIGATNVARVYGWRLAGPVMALDVAKGLLPVLAVRWLWPEVGLVGASAVAFVAWIGHCFPIYLELRGGKGVATGAGGLLGIAPVPTLLAGAVWLLLLAVTGRSSVAALGATASMVGFAGWLVPGVLPLALLLAIGVGFTHVANIRRLVRGEEREVVRPVRWGRHAAAPRSAEQVLREGPAGAGEAPSLWREETFDPLSDLGHEGDEADGAGERPEGS